MTGEAFREALGAHLDALSMPEGDQPGRTYRKLLEAARAHAEASGPVDPVMQPEGPDCFAPAPLVAEYERLRDDPAADRVAVLAAAGALATARQAHRVAQGLPLTAAAG